MAGIEWFIESQDLLGQAWTLRGDSISPPSSYSPEDSCHHTTRLDEDGVPVAMEFSSTYSGEDRQQESLLSSRNLNSMPNDDPGCPKSLFMAWEKLHQSFNHHPFYKDLLGARMRKEPIKRSRLEVMLDVLREDMREIECALIFLQEIVFSSGEKLLKRIYERLRLLYYRLALYALACLWSFSEFPGRIRPPCTTMPWTIWPALVVLWGVCWMFYPSPGGSPTELEGQSLFDYQLQPEQVAGELPFSLNDIDHGSYSFLDPSFSDEWWAHQQPSTIHDGLITTMDHDMEVYPPDSRSQPIPVTTGDPIRSLTNSQSGTAAQVALSPGVQPQSRSQEIGAVVEDIIDNIVTTPSRPIAASRLKCPDCDKILSRHDSLKRHQQTQHNREVKEHLCPHKSCRRSRHGSGFSRPDGLQRHLKAHESRRRRVATVAVESVDTQPDSGNETREDSQAPSSRRDTRSMGNPDDTNNQQLSPDSLIVGLRRRLAEAKVACDRAKREYDEAQRKVANYQATIEMLEKEPTA